MLASEMEPVDVTELLKGMVLAAGDLVQEQVERFEAQGHPRHDLIALVVHSSHPTSAALTALAQATGGDVPKMTDGSRVMVMPRPVMGRLADLLGVADHIRRPPTDPRSVWCVAAHREGVVAVPLGWSGADRGEA